MSTPLSFESSVLHAAAILAVAAAGLAALLAADNLLRKIMGLSVLNTAVIILFVYLGSLGGREAPILVGALQAIADPLPQELMLTAIVVGVSVTALALALALRLHARYGTLSARRIRDLVAGDDG